MTALADVVVKVGGSLARAPGLAARLAPLADLRRRGRTVVVPGGGPFRDVVRELWDRHGLDESTAHWMGVLAMNQYAHLLACLLPDAELVRDPSHLAAALRRGRLPVLAPYRWLRAEDPLPHEWSVTSDSIAAWFAGRLGARKLVVVKSAVERAGVDPYFSRALPPGVEVEIVAAEGGGWRPVR